MPIGATVPYQPSLPYLFHEVELLAYQRDFGHRVTKKIKQSKHIGSRTQLANRNVQAAGHISETWMILYAASDQSRVEIRICRCIDNYPRKCK